MATADYKANRLNANAGILILLTVLLLIKLVIVLAALPKINSLFPGLYNIADFSDDYHRIAINLINGCGYRFYPDTALTLVRGPGYVMILAGLFRFFGPSLAAAQVFNIFLSALTACIIFYLARRMFKNIALTVSAPVIFLLHPAIVFSESRAGVECLLAFFSALLVFLTYKALTGRGYWYYAAAGCALGASLLVKSTLLLFPFFIIPVFFIYKRGKDALKRAALASVFFVAAACIVYSPWVIRNYYVTGKFAPAMTIKGTTAYQGMYINKNIFSGREYRQLMDEATDCQAIMAQGLGLKFRDGFFQYFLSARDEVMFDSFVFKKAMAEYASSAPFLLRSVLFNFLGFWFQGRTHAASCMNFILSLPLIAFSVIGAFKGYKRGPVIMLILVFSLAYILPHLLILGIARYYVPLIPLLSLLCLSAFLPAGETERSFTI
ncbi:MAG: glycosyltransferase family 39 protein [Candidatus Omnitrophica bacterium]|nr:glycosyltransferase family 39 protein [Candidatus Omnitrophota bacterium]